MSLRFPALPLVLLSLLTANAALPVSASIDITQAVYRADQPFPEYTSCWSEGWPAVDAEGRKMKYVAPLLPYGGYVHIYFRNTGTTEVTVKDVLLDGVSLKEAVAHSKSEHMGYYPAGIHYSKLSKDVINKVVDSGEPVWWKIEPSDVIPSGGIGELVVRLRRTPKSGSVSFWMISNEKHPPVKIVVKKVQPRFADISFSEKLDKVYLFAEHTKAGVAPKRILLNGRDVTSDSRIVSDPNLKISPTILSLREPLTTGTYCIFEAVYPNGSKASAGLRAWGHEMVYGMWGSKGHHRDYLPDWVRHNINVQMGMWAGDGKYMVSKECLDLMNSLGMRQMATWYGNALQPLFYFLQDEPDAQDYAFDEIPVLDRLGVLGQPLIEKSIDLRKKDPKTPHLLNIDNTFKPANYYTYSQLADVPCADPYYGVRVGNTSMSTPEQLAFHIKPYVVYAASSIYHSTASPKPMHIILVSTGPEKPGDGRFPTPEEKRMEVVYALAAGAKGLSYWWFTPGGGGCGEDLPEAKALYREIGLLGAQVRTIGPVIMKSTPAVLPVEADSRLFVKTLLAGDDTVVLLLANNDVVCDRKGTAFMPVEDAKVTVTLPAWLNLKRAFEITQEGTKPVKWTSQGSKASLDAGTVDLTRIIVLTSNTELRDQLDKLYRDKLEVNVKNLLAE